MTVELKIEKVVITRGAPKGITDKGTVVTVYGPESGDRADVYIVIKSADVGQIQLAFHFSDYASLDDAVEKARQAVLAFASDLAKAAERSPLT
jgi:hypothetical protein